MITLVHYTKQLSIVESRIAGLLQHDMFETDLTLLTGQRSPERQEQLEGLLTLRMQILNEIARILGYKLVKENEYRY